MQIERLTRPVDDADVQALAQLLIDAVDSGAAVSFVLPLTIARAQAWWRATIADSPPGAVLLVARDHEGIAGTVQLQPAWAPNQPHRAEVVELLVHRRAQRSGIGAQLMHAVEAAALSGGFSLLTLDAKRGAIAERLYQKLGWTHAGTIRDMRLIPTAHRTMR